MRRARVKIKVEKQIPETTPEEEGVRKVKRRILVGPEDGSARIIMRYFKVLPGGNTPFHEHDFEHVVRIENGKGVVVDSDRKELTVFTGHSIFIPGGEKHQFKNPYHEPFEFICTIPNPEAKR
jgi:quercetin dioxygenase-like cupin family protein